MPNPKLERLLKNRKKGKKGPKPAIQRHRADQADLVPLDSVPLSRSAKRALSWIKKGRFDTLNKEDLEDIVRREIEKAQEAAEPRSRDPTARNFKRDIRPLTSKPPSRNALKRLGEPSSRVRSTNTPRGDKPSNFKSNEIYKEDGWSCCGYCSIATINEKQFTEHKHSAKHQLKVSLSTFRDVDECLCGKLFKTTNKVHKYRHVSSCDLGKKLLK